MDSSRSGATEVARHALSIDLGHAVSIAAGTATYLVISSSVHAVPVRFENDGSLGGIGTILDITLPAAAQSGSGNPYALTGSQVHLTYGFDVYLPYYTQYYTQLRAGDAVARNTSFFVKAFAAGELIGAADTFVTGVRSMFEYRTDCFYDYDTYEFQCSVSYPGEFVNDGSIQYAGVRLDLGGTSHYGWIALRHSGTYAPTIDLVAWGYETEPGVAVAAGAPTPSTLAGLALGATAFAGRKRRD
ncbi:MAG: PEP-CTERM sorting domain-containing protein [Phycisphaerales bacterium]|nr:PEP-CTERM sorting domain-containing protein [Phycisphaerales bacterium]